MPKIPAPDVSVIVPTYNRAHYLKEAVESIRLQNVSTMEIILVDDGSTDNTSETVQQIRDTYPSLRINYIRQENAGISSARNAGISSANGEWIAFLDSDDRWRPGKIQKQLEYVHEHAECEIVFSRYQNFIDGSVDTPNVKQRTLLEEEDHWCLASALVRKDLFRRCGLYAEDMSWGEDSEWVTRVKLLGVDIGHCLEEVLYDRRIHSDNISLDNTLNIRRRTGFVFSSAIRNANKMRRVQNENICTNSGV